jgi:hypothetical protein
MFHGTRRQVNLIRAMIKLVPGNHHLAINFRQLPLIGGIVCPPKLKIATPILPNAGQIQTGKFPGGQRWTHQLR